MPDQPVQPDLIPPPIPPRDRTVPWTQRILRPAGTILAIAMTVLLFWHVFYGRDGISVWQKKRAEDRELRKEIDRYQQENGQLRDRIQHLQSDPDAIQHQAREELHYAKPGEVIYTLPPPPQAQSPA
ncbi:MAG: FtsB family cell division protein, partial [Terracidiphilus sp.]